MTHNLDLAISKIAMIFAQSSIHETWSKSFPHEILILTKFHKNHAKIVELLLMANYLFPAMTSSIEFMNK